MIEITPYPMKPRYDEEDAELLLHHLAEQHSFNDLYLASEQRVIVKVKGRHHFATARELSHKEISSFLIKWTRDKGCLAILSKGEAIDDRVEVLGENKKLHAYRLNASGCRARGGGPGIKITLREQAEDPKSVEELKVRQQILEHAFPRQGMVLVVGETGSGKSTLLGAFIRAILEGVGLGKNVVTAEAPIEICYDNIDWGHNRIDQAEVKAVGGDFTSFAEAIRAFLRQSPDVIVVGEMRDAETIIEGMKAASSGHAMYSTLHANSIAECFQRVASEFPPEARDGKILSFILSLRAIIVQYLARTEKGYVPIQEYLPFTNEVRAKLVSELNSSGLNVLPHVISELLTRYGWSFQTDAKLSMESGKINEDTYKYIVSGT